MPTRNVPDEAIVTFSTVPALAPPTLLAIAPVTEAASSCTNVPGSVG